MIEWIENHDHLAQVQERNKKFLVLIFHANFSAASKRAMTELEQFSKENKDVPVYVINVERIKGVNEQFGVDNVPTVLVRREGKVTFRI